MSVFRDDNSQVIRSDVLVIGGGLAGTWAAIRAADFVEDVVLVDKARVSRSGSSTSAAGVILAPMPGDDLDLWMKEIVERGDYLNDQDWVQVFLADQVQRIAEMDSWGTNFERDEKGNIARVLGRAHENTRIIMFHGKKLMEKMREQVLKRNIKLVERVTVTDLLTSDGLHPTQGRVAGAVGFDSRTGERYRFDAKATVVAAGPIYPKRGGEYVDNINGDGGAMAFRAGADLMGMEFCTAGHLKGIDRKYWLSGLNMFQGLGARFVNAQGERFMEKYDPVLLERSKLCVLTQAFCKEALEGRGPLYCDMRHLSPDALARLRRVVPQGMLIFDRARIDLSKQMFEYTPLNGVFVPSGDGGVRVNTSCETSLAGLFAAGGATKMLPHGTYSVGGVNLAYCCVSGHRAGEFAARYAGAFDQAPVRIDQVRGLQADAFAPMGRESGASSDDLFEKVLEVTVPAEYSTFKHENRIRKTLAALAELRASLGELTAASPHELLKANEARNYLTCTELVFLSALLRKESRGGHYREEYPYRDDDNWLKWIVLRREANSVAMRIEHVPIWRYPVRPEGSGRKPNPVQFFLEKGEHSSNEPRS